MLGTGFKKKWAIKKIKIKKKKEHITLKTVTLKKKKEKKRKKKRKKWEIACDGLCGKRSEKRTDVCGVPVMAQGK